MALEVFMSYSVQELGRGWPAKFSNFAKLLVVDNLQVEETLAFGLEILDQCSL